MMIASSVTLAHGGHIAVISGSFHSRIFPGILLV